MMLLGDWLRGEAKLTLFEFASFLLPGAMASGASSGFVDKLPACDPSAHLQWTPVERPHHAKTHQAA